MWRTRTCWWTTAPCSWCVTPASSTWWSPRICSAISCPTRPVWLPAPPIGLLPSASIGDTAPGLYEPIHGSAPDIAGQDKANPIATILSVAMMFRYSFHLAAEADAVEAAVDAVLAEGWRTADIAEPGVTPIGTKQMGDLICQKI